MFDDRQDAVHYPCPAAGTVYYYWMCPDYIIHSYILKIGASRLKFNTAFNRPLPDPLLSLNSQYIPNSGLSGS